MKTRGKIRAGKKSRVAGSDVRVNRHHDERIIIPIANVAEENQRFVAELASQVS